MIKGVLSLSLFVKAKSIGTTCGPLISDGFDNCFEHCRHCFESLFLLFFCSHRQSWQPIIWSQPQLGAWQYDNVTAVPRLSGRTLGLFHPFAFTVTSPTPPVESFFVDRYVPFLIARIILYLLCFIAQWKGLPMNLCHSLPSESDPVYLIHIILWLSHLFAPNPPDLWSSKTLLTILIRSRE